METVLELDENSQGKDKSQPANNYNHRDVPLSSALSCLAISCDETTLSVSIIKDDVPFALMYDVRAFASTVSLIIHFLIDKHNDIRAYLKYLVLLGTTVSIC